jgi:two-component system cell cycle sensor histidine kinase/response regulator CckA
MTALDHYLKDKRPFLESVFNAIQNGVIVLDQDFTIVRTNRWMEKKYASQMPLIDKKCYDLFRNGKGACSKCPYTVTLDTGKPHIEVVPYPSEQNPTEWFEVSMFRLEDDNGKVMGAVGHVQDITEHKNEEKQKEILETHLRKAQRMEALGTLAGGIAHDFNNILSAIYGYSELAQLRCPENSKLRHYIDQISMASNRAKHLVQQILAFSRQGKSEKRMVDISDVIGETVKLIEATFPATIDIKHHIAPHAGNLFADETQIHQVLMNLCTNAYHSMQKEGGLLEVELAPATIGTFDSSSYPILNPGKYLKLVVADTGHGMDQDLLDQIFDPYFTTKKSGVGTGMGLSTAHGIVKDHGGSIKVSSRPGIGTTFQVFFPIAEAASQRPAAESGRFSSGKGSILLVDDETPILDSGKAFLEDLGYEVDVSTCPVDALELVQTNPDKYHLVITDMIMPKMSGENLAKAIKKDRPDIPILLWTGYSENINADTIAEAGVSEVLLKPITLSHLANTIQKVLNDHASE